MEGSKRVQQIVIITIIWALALIAVHVFGDKPTAPVALSTGDNGPRIVMHFKHLCCTGCGDSAFQAVKRFTWLGQPKIMAQGAAQPLNQGLMDQQKRDNQTRTMAQPAGTDYGRDIVADMNTAEVSKDNFDFVQLSQAVRDTGLVASNMEITGIPHFQLVAYLPHMCCSACQTAVEEALPADNSASAASAQPMPGHAMAGKTGAIKVDVDMVKQFVTAEFRDHGDVGVMMQALEQAGFAPKTIHMEIFGS
jgi:hypothetical protein